MRYVRQELSPFDGLTDLEIATAIRNSTGTRIPLFVPEGSFDLLVRRQIKKLEYLVRAG
jgi:dynamin 1-like protein